MKAWTRKVFILFALFSIYSPFLTAQTLQRFEYEQPKIGTTIKIIFYADAQYFADSIAKVAYQKVDTLNQILSNYLPESEVNRLSQQAGNRKWIKVSKELWTVLSFGQRMAKQSKGKFDMTIAPLSKLWRKAFRQQTFPKKENIKVAKKLVNYKQLELNPTKQSARLKHSDMCLDLGGIAKGYIVDETVGLLQNAGIQSILVDAGGDIRVTTPPPDQNTWKIQLGEKQLDLQHIAIATSGATYQYLEWNSKRFSHIIHPKKGKGISNPHTVTVKAKTCMEADVWASLLSVKGKRGIYHK
ncbi:MAG: FAD:protein FMN transferase [Bacteroidota bacterium]